jgi:calcineurin-binding protein cabin-1
MLEIDDGALTSRCGGVRGAGSFKLLNVGMNESGRKYVAATRRATRLFLALSFAAGDLEGLRALVAAPAHIRDERRRFARSMPDLGALALAYAARAVAAALEDPSRDARTTEEASALAYWLWVEHGVVNGGAEGWDEAAAEAREEARLEFSFVDENSAASKTRGDEREAAALADAPPNLIGRPFAEAFAASAAADTSAAAFAAHAKAYVEAVAARGDVHALLTLYQDAGKRAAEAARRLKARRARSLEPSLSKAPSAAELEAVSAPARALRDALRGSLLAALEAIVGVEVSAAQITESVVRARFAAVAAARALHRERAAATAAAARDAENAAKAAEYAVAAASNADALLAQVQSGDDPMDAEPAEGTDKNGPAPGSLRQVLYGEADGEAERARDRAQRLSRLKDEARNNRERVRTSAASRDRLRTLAFEQKAQEAEVGKVLVRAVRAVKKMMGAATGDEDANRAETDEQALDEEDDFGEGAQGAAAVPRPAGAPAAPTAVDPVVVAAAEADMLLKAREASLRATEASEKKKTPKKGPARRAPAP